jgi:hypothetical protein
LATYMIQITITTSKDAIFRSLSLSRRQMSTINVRTL